MGVRLQIPIACVALLLCGIGEAQQKPGAQAHQAFAHALAGGGGRVEVEEVTYPPGGESAPHRHPCSVVGYVLEGALRMQVEGAPETLYKAGDYFYEDANVLHKVSANASDREQARFLAFFVCNDAARKGDK